MHGIIRTWERPTLRQRARRSARSPRRTCRGHGSFRSRSAFSVHIARALPASSAHPVGSLSISGAPKFCIHENSENIFFRKNSNLRTTEGKTPPEMPVLWCILVIETGAARPSEKPGHRAGKHPGNPAATSGAMDAPLSAGQRIAGSTFRGPCLKQHPAIACVEKCATRS